MADNAQVHDRFKLFIGTLDDAGHVTDLANVIHEWVAKDKVAVKSVGAAVSNGKLMLTIGFRDDEPTYEVALHSSKIGRVGALDADETSRFTRAIESGGMNWPPVIGHSLYVTKNNDLYLAVLSLVEPPRE
jgi:hypothetical protein